MPEISIIIPSLKPQDEIECVEVLDQQSFTDYEVLVQQENRATTARNEGIKRANADKLVFLDDDSRPREGYLSRIVDTLENEAAVVGRTIHPRDDIFARRFAGRYDLGDEPRYITHLLGCNMAVRKEVFEEVGLWDENISWGHEEVELAERVLTLYPIYYDPELVIEHVYADSTTDYWSKMYRLEKQKPYLWNKRGVSEKQQYINVISSLLDLSNYLGRTPEHAVVRGGGHIAGIAGQVHGLIDAKFDPFY